MRQLGFIAIAACIKYELTFSEIRAHERALLSHNNISYSTRDRRKAIANF